jgi:uncharacterized protein YbaR (Trm112 family)/ubiquinone/menaquinone biosynthesis C-methylase UbiE
VKPRLLELLACPFCHGQLSLETGRRQGDEIVEGRFECDGCRQGYPLLRGVPRLLPPNIGLEQQRTATAFGQEWRHFVEMHPEYEAQFLDRIHPIEPAFFQGKFVLDAGAGIGRHAYFAASYAAHVVQGDIYNPPLRIGAETGGFDLVYSIGVLHHLPDPRAGFRSLVRFVKPAGTIFAWVYGHENYAVVHWFINPVRKALTTRIPQPAVRAVSWPLAVCLHALVKGVYGPLEGSRASGRLPSRSYLTSLSRFGFRQNHNIVFDQLIAPTTFYLKREEFESWFSENQPEEAEISWRNQNSWRGRGRRRAAVTRST